MYHTNSVSCIICLFVHFEHTCHSNTGLSPQNGEPKKLHVHVTRVAVILVSQARPTSARGKGLVNSVYKPCPGALYSAPQLRCSILSHDALHHCFSSNRMSLENSEREPGHSRTATVHFHCDLISRKWAFFYKMAAFCGTLTT